MKAQKNQEAANFLLEDFQRKVDSAIQDYEWRTTTTPRRRPHRMGGRKAPHRKPTRKQRESAKKMERNIAKLLRRPEIRESLCQILQNISDDTFEISKAVTPVLLTLIATGVLNIETKPLMFAGIILSIARMGISAFCSKKPTKTKGVASAKSTKNGSAKRK